MLMPQLSIFVQDKVGRVAEICGLLAQQQINIAGFDIADTTEGFGILHLVVDKPDAALQALHERHFVVRSTPVICVKLENRPGRLARVLGLLSQVPLSVEYMYLGSDNNMFIGTERNDLAASVLGDADFRMLHAHDLIPGEE
jgi:hypothetical protein